MTVPGFVDAVAADLIVAMRDGLAEFDAASAELGESPLTEPARRSLLRDYVARYLIECVDRSEGMPGREAFIGASTIAAAAAYREVSAP